MPNPDTFSIKPIKELLDRYLNSDPSYDLLSIDPFARNSKVATFTNDLNPQTDADWHMDAVEFCRMYVDAGSFVDAVLFDPPYSPRQISECYKIAGIKVGMKETQNARLYKAVKDELDKLLVRGGIAISCGWNSGGFGVGRGYEIIELLLINHGGAHNDTIVTVERKV